MDVVAFVLEVLLRIYINFISVSHFICISFLTLKFCMYRTFFFYATLYVYFLLFSKQLFIFLLFFLTCYLLHFGFFLFFHFTAAVVAIAKGHEATKYIYLYSYATQTICCVGRSTHVQKPLLLL